MSDNPPERLQRRLQHADTPVQVFAGLDEAYDSIDKLAAEYVSSNSVHLDCCANCSWCCHLRVDAKAHEVLAIAHYVQKHFPTEKRNALIDRLQRHSARVRKLTYVQHLATNVACPLLVDGRCSAYAVRPFGCRRKHSQTVKNCEDSFNHPEDLTSPPDEHMGLLTTFCQGEHSLQTAFAVSGYDTTGYEFGTALLKALTNPKSWRRWKKKKKTFLNALTVPANIQT